MNASINLKQNSFQRTKSIPLQQRRDFLKQCWNGMIKIGMTNYSKDLILIYAHPTKNNGKP